MGNGMMQDVRALYFFTFGGRRGEGAGGRIPDTCFLLASELCLLACSPAYSHRDSEEERERGWSIDPPPETDWTREKDGLVVSSSIDPGG